MTLTDPIPMETREVTNKVDLDYLIVEDIIAPGVIGCPDPNWWELPRVYWNTLVAWWRDR